ncbi:MAG: hypothetical protein ACE5DK_09795 [Paracoccaceae bacterium]
MTKLMPRDKLAKLGKLARLREKGALARFQHICVQTNAIDEAIRSLSISGGEMLPNKDDLAASSMFEKWCEWRDQKLKTLWKERSTLSLLEKEARRIAADELGRRRVIDEIGNRMTRRAMEMEKRRLHYPD